MGSGVVLVVIANVVVGNVDCLVGCLGGTCVGSVIGFHGLYNDLVTYDSLVVIGRLALEVLGLPVYLSIKTGLGVVRYKRVQRGRSVVNGLTQSGSSIDVVFTSGACVVVTRFRFVHFLQVF